MMKKTMTITLALLALVFLNHDGVRAAHPLEGNYQEKEKDVLVDVNGDGQFVNVKLPESEAPAPLIGWTDFYKSVYGTLNYPAEAREKGIQGKVVLKVTYNALGMAENTTVQESAHPLLDAAAQKAFSQSTQSQFTPLVLEGHAKRFQILLPVTFRVE